MRALYRPSIPIEDWTVEGVSGKCPCARGGWQLEIVKDKVWVYGGWEGEGKTRIFFDDVYCLDMKAKTWTLIYRCDIDVKLASARYYVMVPADTAPIIMALAKGAVKGQVHFFPCIGNADQLRDEFIKNGCAKL